MKRVIVTILILFFAGAALLTAQQFKDESEYYPKTVPIGRIYPHELGYRIDFIKQDYSIGTIYAPSEWFRSAASIGEIAYGSGPAYPYATFFYKDGEVDHFRLYLIESYGHESWGRLEAGVDYSGEFPPDDSKPQIVF